MALVTHTFLRQRREEIIAAWEAAVTAERRDVKLTGVALRDHLPSLLDELADWLEGGENPGTPRMHAAAGEHAAARIEDTYRVSQVIRELQLLRSTILRLLLRSEAAEQASDGDAGRERRVEELARLNAGLDRLFADVIEPFVAAQADKLQQAERAARAGESGLRASEERFRALVTATSDVLYRMNPDWSEMRQLTGGGFLANTDAPNRRWMEMYIHPDDQARVKAVIDEAIRTRRTFTLEHRVVREDGTLGWTFSRAIPVTDERGDVVEWFGAAVDVTDRKRAEEALRAANEQLRDSDRRKDEFLGMLSHELRNPLAPIRNSIYLLERAAPGTEPARRAQDVIRRQTEHLTRLVDDLLDVTRIARGKIDLHRSRVDLREIVLHAAEDFRLLLQDRGVGFAVTVPDSRAWADADPTRITQVIGNLLHNASKFTRSGDRVTVTMKVVDRSAEIRVRDTGAGIAPALLPLVFDPFFQGERTLARTQGGLGLGLALVKGITELHGGTVSVQSAGKGQGAEFVVRLPLAAAGAHEAARSAPAQRQDGGRRVLVVDDNADAAESLADIARLAGHDVDVAYDGEGALEKARANPPDVVLCDIGLPDMSGYDVARTLRAANGRTVRLIAVSGYAQPDDVRQSLDAGFDAHVAKPPDINQLMGLLAAAH